MPIKLKAISRVVIRGEWISVENGSFQIEPLQITDDNGTPVHPDLGVWAYSFRTDTKDTYYGPLNEVQLFKIASI